MASGLSCVECGEEFTSARPRTFTWSGVNLHWDCQQAREKRKTDELLAEVRADEERRDSAIYRMHKMLLSAASALLPGSSENARAVAREGAVSTAREFDRIAWAAAERFEGRESGPQPTRTEELEIQNQRLLDEVSGLKDALAEAQWAIDYGRQMRG